MQIFLSLSIFWRRGAMHEIQASEAKVHLPPFDGGAHLRGDREQ
jgi:hypothetical protein